MATQLQVIGPVVIARTGFIDSKHIKQFWMKEKAEEVVKKQGCYIFTLKAGKGFTPWYVGKTIRSMKGECLKAYQLNIYNGVLHKRNGTPALFFVVPQGKKKMVPKGITRGMETFLIQCARSQNRHLANRQKVKQPRWSIKGVIRTTRGQPSRGAQVFRTMMGM